MIGRGDASEQGTREHEQAQPDDASGEVRNLQHRQWQEAVQHGQPSLDSWRRARQEQHRAGQERERAGDLRHDRRDIDRRQLVRSRESQPVGRQLLGPEQHGAAKQGHQVVDRPVRQQRRRQGLSRHIGRQRREDHRLEYADAAWNVADDAGDDGGGVGREKTDQPNIGLGREHYPEHGCRQAEIDDGDTDLAESDQRTGRPQRPTPDLQVDLRERAPAGVGDDGREQRGADGQRQAAMQVQDGDRVRRADQEGDARDCGEPDSDRQAGERGDGRDVDRGDAGGRIQAEADRSAGEGREAQSVTEGVGDERGEYDARVGYRLAQIAQRHQVIEAQQPVARRGAGESDQDAPPGKLVQLCEHLADVQLRQLTVQNVDDGAEDDERGERSDPTGNARPFLPYASVHRPPRRC